jgi:hypothetical protein
LRRLPFSGGWAGGHGVLLCAATFGRDGGGAVADSRQRPGPLLAGPAWCGPAM